MTFHESIEIEEELEKVMIPSFFNLKYKKKTLVHFLRKKRFFESILRMK